MQKKPLFPDSPATPRVYFVSSGLPFAWNFANGLRARLGGAPSDILARTKVFVSGRREVGLLQAAFRDTTGSRCGFTPSIHSLREVAFDPSITVHAPKSVDTLHRTLTLARLVDAFHSRNSTPANGDGVVALADALGKLLDELHAAGIQPSSLGGIVPDQLADHWRRASRFLDIIGEAWPAYLRENDLEDPERCRAVAVDALIENWSRFPPADPILVAGSTATDATTARLMSAIASLPAGAVVLPGLDRSLDLDAWNAIAGPDRLAPEHPQFTMKLFLERIGVNRKNVPPWTDDTQLRLERTRFIGQALRPAPVTEAWRMQAATYDEIAAKAMADVDLIEARNADEEASAIAFVLRESLETEGLHAMFVTEDNELRARVIAKCARWGLVPDDSRGQSLARTPEGRFAILSARVALGPPDSAVLLALLKSPRCRSGPEQDVHLKLLSRTERILRSRTVQTPGFEGIRRALEEWEEDGPERGETAAELLEWLASLEADLAPLSGHAKTQEVPLSVLLESHRKAMAGLERTGSIARKRSERERFFERLEAEAGAYASMRPKQYALFLSELLRSQPVFLVPLHPRIAIRGTLEARFAPMDMIVLGGLNEDTAPGKRAEDPWLNRAMRTELGLPPPERAVGTLAHDMAELFAARKVVLSRSENTRGEIRVPSRWLLRLTNLLEGVGEEGEQALAGIRARGKSRLSAAMLLDRPGGPPTPVSRPEPRPPIAARPRKLSATAFETLLKDPYAIYARYVLGLRPLESLGSGPDARIRGIIFHAVLADFCSRIRSTRVPRSELSTFLDKALEGAFDEVNDWPWLADLWAGSFAEKRNWLLSEELHSLQDNWLPTALEAEGAISLAAPEGPFEITARADRLDSRTSDSGVLQYRLRDYKSGRAPTKASIEEYAWQLRIGALIASEGGFSEVEPGEIQSAEYAGFQGGRFADEGRVQPDPLPDLREFRAELEAQVARYDSPETGYLSHAIPSAARQGDFDHLARVAEWSTPALEDEND